MAKPKSKTHPPCPLCGGTKFTRGSLTALAPCGFAPEGQGLVSKFVGLTEKVATIKCDACGYLLQFAAPEHEPESPDS